ncbi:hypothetical protein [Streptomyces sp. NPDC058657]|uniref:hypothetical protein n=1 Tax=unclassified Streptomyces TaxID=2593676 RepID=UPI0036678020
MRPGLRGARGLAVVLLAFGLLTGCWNGGGGGSSGGGEGPGKETGHGLPVTSSGYGAVFLDVRECSSYGKTPREVSCASERAAARVVARYNGPAGETSSCPPRTDFVLHLSESGQATDEDGDGVVPLGYACMRNLQAPHPGDPGGGGGPHTVVGDCVYGAGDGKVKETACDGSGGREPEFKVSEAVGSRARCPSATRLYVRLDGGRPVGCASPLR